MIAGGGHAAKVRNVSTTGSQTNRPLGSIACCRLQFTTRTRCRPILACAILGSSMSLAEKYIHEGHPTIDELVAEQQLAFPCDLTTFLATSGQKRSPSTI